MSLPLAVQQSNIAAKEEWIARLIDQMKKPAKRGVDEDDVKRLPISTTNRRPINNDRPLVDQRDQLPDERTATPMTSLAIRAARVNVGILSLKAENRELVQEVAALKEEVARLKGE